MKIAVMQPYFFPYIGYFQLLNAVDEFIVYDNIQYTKRGWINRNRILSNGRPDYFTIPLKNESDFLDIDKRHIAPEWLHERKRVLNRITESYRKAPCFNDIFPLIRSGFLYDDDNLFWFLFNSLMVVSTYLEIKTPVIISSSLDADHSLKSADRVISICKSRNAGTYLNPEGGTKLYDKDYFRDRGIDLNFLISSGVRYRQFQDDFVPSLSIIDVMMFNSPEKTSEFLRTAFDII